MKKLIVSESLHYVNNLQQYYTVFLFPNINSNWRVDELLVVPGDRALLGIVLLVVVLKYNISNEIDIIGQIHVFIAIFQNF
jgi:hypothetical protein